VIVTAGTAPPARLLSVRALGFLACAFFSAASFFLLWSALPLAASPAGPSAAGLVTGISMLGCVATEVLVAARVVRLGHVPAMAIGTALLTLGAGLAALPAALEAVPGPLLTVPGALALGRQELPLLVSGHGLALLLGASFVRGVGLGILVVAGTSIAADLAPPGRRGELLGLYGLAETLPGAVGLPAGVWVASQFGFSNVYLLAFAFGALSICLSFVIPPRRWKIAGPPITFGVLRHERVRRPAVVLLTTSIAAGIYASFLPIAMSGESASVVALALFAQTAAAAIVRWVAGWAGDRLGARRLLVPSVLIGVAGAVLAIAVWEPAFAVAGMLLFGIGFGALLNLTLALMYEGAPERGFGGVSAVWNTAIDAGTGAGAVGFGFLSQVGGFPVGFAATAAVLGVGLFPAVRDSADRVRLNR
jgi:MFS family permease